MIKKIRNYIHETTLSHSQSEVAQEFRRGYAQGQLYCMPLLTLMPFFAAADIKELAGKGLGIFGVIALIIMVGAILAGIAMSIADGSVSRAKFAFGIAILAGIALPFVKAVLEISGFKLDGIEPEL